MSSARHNCIIAYTRRWRDLLQRRYWARCVQCGQMAGAYSDQDAANDARRFLDTYTCPSERR